MQIPGESLVPGQPIQILGTRQSIKMPGNSLIPGQLAHMPGDSRSCAHIYVAIVTAVSLGQTEHGSYQKACVHRNLVR